MALVVFQDKNIRRIWHDDEWYFSVVDVVGALTESKNPTDYLKKLRKRDEELANYVGTNCPQVEMKTPTGKKRFTLAGNTKDIFRLVQSIPSKKAEPFKQWLAKVGYERIEEIQDPELAQKRMKELYRKKGYSDDWIEKRVRGIAIRDELTQEWKIRDVRQQKEFAILTAEISKETFGMTPKEYRQFKGLKRENLRDHMDDLELIFSMLGERVSTEITRSKNSQGFEQCETAAKEGGQVAGTARKDAEKRIGKPVIKQTNYLELEKNEPKEKELSEK